MCLRTQSLRVSALSITRAMAYYIQGSKLEKHSGQVRNLCVTQGQGRRKLAWRNLRVTLFMIHQLPDIVCGNFKQFLDAIPIVQGHMLMLPAVTMPHFCNNMAGLVGLGLLWS